MWTQANSGFPVPREITLAAHPVVTHAGNPKTWGLLSEVHSGR